MPTRTGAHAPQRHPDRLDRRIAKLPPRLRWAAGVVRLTLREPVDSLDRILVRLRNLRDPGEHKRHEYAVDADWHRRLHERLGLDWPCGPTNEFERLWPQIVAEANAQGVALGRGTYGGWDDADPGLARAVWCLMVHLRPKTVVETGVARGVTSRVILEALERSGSGHLWSIDLPAMDPSLHHEIGVAVPERLRGRWTYITGTSRRRLPRLLSEIGPIQFFVHDSSHTERNVGFELSQAWGAMEQGVILADDIDQSAAFGTFAARLPDDASLVVQADDGSALFGIALRRITHV